MEAQAAKMDQVLLQRHQHKVCVVMHWLPVSINIKTVILGLIVKIKQ